VKIRNQVGPADQNRRALESGLIEFEVGIRRPVVEKSPVEEQVLSEAVLSIRFRNCFGMI
jgi:hypothetical protein